MTLPRPLPRGELVAFDDAVAAALRAALAPNTWRAYAADWRHWSAWAAGYDLPALPAVPLDLARYLVDHAGLLTIGTLTRRLSAVSKAHALSGHADPGDDPAVREVLRGLRRQYGTAKRGAPPLWTSDLEQIVAASLVAPSPEWGLGLGTAEVRDRALLLLAFTSALRRSELSALDVADLERDPAGLIVHVRRSKTDAAGEGACVGIPHASRPRLCAVLAIDAWLDRLAQLIGTPLGELAGPLLRPVDRHGQLGSLGASRHGRRPGCRNRPFAMLWCAAPASPGSPPHTATGSSPPTPPGRGLRPRRRRTAPASARSWTRVGGSRCR